MNFIKKNWKNILIILLALLLVTTCVGKGNYKRKYNKEVEHVEHVTDSLGTVYGNGARSIDSLGNVIRMKDVEISGLESQLEIYRKNSERAIKITIDSTGVRRK